MRGTNPYGYILLPVVLAITLIATIAFLLNRESALDVELTAGGMAAEKVERITQAGLAHATWATQASGCAGDFTLLVHTLDNGTYSATVTAGSTSTAYTLWADQDTWLKESSPTENHGTDDRLSAKNATGDGMRALYRFNLVALPPGAQIASAVAWFFVESNDDEGPVTVHRITSDWTEGGADWASVGAQFDNQVLETIPTQSDKDVWVQLNLTSQVQAWINGAEPNYGVMLIATSADNESRYTSREWGTAAERPRLEVVTISGAASPVSITATGTLANGVSRTLTRNGVTVYQPPASIVWQPGAELEDAFIWDGAHKNKNFGTSPILNIKNDRNVLIRYALQALPPGARVTDARLELYLEGGGGVINGVLDLHAINRSWVEGIYDDVNPATGDGVTYMEHDGGNLWTTPGGDYDAAIIDSITLPTMTPGWYEWNVTRQLQAWLNGAPNYGFLLREGGGDAGDIDFVSSDNTTTPQFHPRLTITLGCECGVACLVPQGSGNLLLIVDDDANLTPVEQALQSTFEAWGYAVTPLSDHASQADIDANVSTHDVVYISETVGSPIVGTKLTNAPIGVVNEKGPHNPQLGIAATTAQVVGTSINVIDNSHYITAPFPSGVLPIYSASMEGITVFGAEAPGLQTLADWNGAGSLVVLDQGMQTTGGGTAAGRRVTLPLGRSTTANFNWDYLNANGRLMVQRAIQWGTGNTGGAPPLIYRDEFTNRNCNSADYTGSDGVLDWSPWAWVEGSDDGNSCGGDIALVEDPVVVDPGNYRVEFSGSNASLTRTADLSAFTTAWLSFDYRRENLLTSNHEVILEFWDDVGGLWIELGRIVGPATDAAYQSISYDVSPYISANAALRLTGRALSPVNLIYIDNVQISETVPPPPPTSLNLLLVVGDAATLDSKDAGRKALMESWGHAVTVIDDGDSQANFDAAAAAADVVYVTASIGGGTLANKLAGSITGLVNEFAGKLDNFGFSSSTTATVHDKKFSTTDAVHYISSPFSGNSVDVFTGSLDMPVPGGTLAPDLQNVGEVSGTLTLVSLTAGATRWDSDPAPARRVHLPFAVAETSELTTDGLTLMQRAIEWAAGAGGGGGGGGGGCDGTYRDEFNDDSYSNNNGTLTWATDWLEINESDGPGAGDERVKGGRLEVNDNDGGGEGAQREADLTGAGSAILTMNYKRKKLDNTSDYVTIDISANGDAGPWVELDRFEGPADDGSFLPASYDIGSYISNNTRIRFLTSPTLGDKDELHFDYVEISCSP